MKISSTINTHKLSISLGSFCFALIFAGFVFYHTLVLNQLIPPFLGGFFVQANILALALLIPFLLRFLKTSLTTSFYFSFFQLIAFSIAAITTLIFAYYDGITDIAVMQSLELLFFWLTLNLVGFYFIQKDKVFLQKILLLLSTAFLIYSLFYMISQGRIMLNFGSTENFEYGEVAGYQSIARSFMLISFFCLAFFKNRLQSIFSTIGFSIILFAIGARSEFYAFLAAILALHLLLSINLRSSRIAVVVILVSVVGLGTYFYDVISESRQFQVFNLEESTSWNAREEFQKNAIQTIHKYPFLGDFGGHVKNGSAGESAHNIISAYTNYGIVFFLIFLLLNLYALFKSTLKLINHPQNKDWNFMFLLSFSTIFLLATGKSVFWVIPYLSWGIFLGIIYNEKRAKL
ncbi:hypothetical protein OHW31_13575 [Acinetobacter baumannii]|nr:hypothetical protein [Acinetobacter baumannii]